MLPRQSLPHCPAYGQSVDASRLRIESTGLGLFVTPETAHRQALCEVTGFRAEPAPSAVISTGQSLKDQQHKQRISFRCRIHQGAQKVKSQRKVSLSVT